MTQSKEPTITEMNEAIALFDGWARYEDKAGIWFMREGMIKCLHPKLQDLRYHISWDALMPVVEKIEALDKRRYGFAIEPTSVIVSDLDRKEGEEQIIWVHEYPDNGDTKISMTYDAVYQFITWYNQQTTTNGTVNG